MYNDSGAPLYTRKQTKLQVNMTVQYMFHIPDYECIMDLKRDKINRNANARYDNLSSRPGVF